MAVPDDPDGGPLPRRFGFWTGLFVVVASMVGSGILTTSGYTLRDTASPAALLLVWGAGGVLALCGSLTLTELATAMPRVGGEYVFVREGFGPAAAFLYGWSTQILGFAGPIAIVATISVDYLAAPLVEWSSDAAILSPQGRRLAATLLVAGFTLAHCLGHRQSAWVQSATTLFKMLTLVGLAIAGLAFGKGSWEHFETGRALVEQRPAVLATALVYVMYGYTGWNGAVYLAGEIMDPPRLLPRCLLAGCLLVTAIYLLVNLAYAYAIDPWEAAAMRPNQVRPVAEVAVRKLFGPGPATAISLLLGFGLLSTLSAFILTGSRVAFVMARDGLLPEIAGALHATRGTPVPATIVQGVLAAGMLWSGPFQTLLDYTSVGLAVVAGLVVASIFPLRRRPGYKAPFRAPAYPLPPLVFLASTALMVALAFRDNPLPAGLSLLSIAAGLPVYHLFVARRTTRAAGP